MAVKRFLLDTSQLNDATYGLDGGLAFILDTSTLNGTRVLDGAEFLTTATGAATLGALSSTATATVSHFATASAELGELVAETADITVTVTAEGSATLGALTASATASVVLVATASASLGGMTATADSTPTILPIFEANLGALSSTATATVITPTPTPAEPVPTGGRMVYSRQPRKKLEPVVQVIETPIIQPKRR
ncbi:MAG: hypothetical protein EBR82_84860, partial [Caulobacteraceae bacterium]|nr:hypothetical protein [Caulobacteraceae bacterium]